MAHIGAALQVDEELVITKKKNFCAFIMFLVYFLNFKILFFITIKYKLIINYKNLLAI